MRMASSASSVSMVGARPCEAPESSTSSEGQVTAGPIQHRPSHPERRMTGDTARWDGRLDGPCGSEARTGRPEGEGFQMPATTRRPQRISDADLERLLDL